MKDGSKNTSRQDFHDQSRSILEKSWQSKTASESKYREEVNAIINGKTKSFRYALLTQILAKNSDLKLDCRSLQRGQKKNSKSFDPRGMCDAVVVPFEREHLVSTLGGSSEPYVNKPLRRQRISAKEITSIRDKDGWRKLCTVLDGVEADPNQAPLVLADIIESIKKRQSKLKKLKAQEKKRQSDGRVIGKDDLRRSLESFLSTPSGGRRLQALVYSYYKALASFSIWDKVSSLHVNTTDAASAKSADVICQKEGRESLYVEVKDKRLTPSDIEASIAKCEQGDQLLFVVSSHSEKDEELIRESLEKGASLDLQIDILTLEDLTKAIDSIGNEGRSRWVNEMAQVIDPEDREDWSRAFHLKA